MFSQRRLIFACALALVLAAGPSTRALTTLSIEPTRTRVGIARVHLEITDLRIDRNRFVGTYEVTIPLAPWRNDRGRIEIDLASPLEDVLSRRGMLTGFGLSDFDGRSHAVVCEFGVDRSVRITIDTGDRMLAFLTRYR